MLARLEEEDVVARVQVRQRVERRVVVVVGFRVEFGVFVGVGQECGEVVEEMSLSVGGKCGQYGTQLECGSRVCLTCERRRAT